jgi:hypothetical protein
MHKSNGMVHGMQARAKARCYVGGKTVFEEMTEAAPAAKYRA